MASVRGFAQEASAKEPAPRLTAEERRASFHEWRKFQAEWPLRRDELLQGRCRAEIMEYVSGEVRIKIPYNVN